MRNFGAARRLLFDPRIYTLQGDNGGRAHTGSFNSSGVEVQSVKGFRLITMGCRLMLFVDTSRVLFEVLQLYHGEEHDCPGRKGDACTARR